MFGDVSSSGFGAAIMINGALHFRYENWSNKNCEIFSNHRELKNLVVSLEQLCEQRKLTCCELFLLTDNSTAEFYIIEELQVTNFYLS